MKNSRNSAVNILRYLLKSEELSQTELAKKMGCSTAYCSRLLNGKRDIHADTWFNICESFNLEYESLCSGIIENRAADCPDFFKKTIPQKENLLTSGRIAYLHIQYFKKCWGEDIFNQFCKEIKIDPIHFVNINNPINLEFNLRLVQYSRMKGRLKNQKEFDYYSQLFNQDIVHSHMPRTYDTSQGLERLVKWVDNSNQYDQNHCYKVEDLCQTTNSITLSYYPKEHVDRNFYLKDHFLGNALTNLIKTCLQGFIGPNVSSKKLECLHNGGEKFVYIYKACPI